MRNTMGAYIDALTDEQRDRIVTSELSHGDWINDGGCGCLVTTAEVESFDGLGVRKLEDTIRERYGKVYGFVDGWASFPPHLRYPYAVRRFGLDRVVRAVKLRAAATTSRQTEAAPEKQTT